MNKLLTAALLTLISVAAHADTWRVDILIYSDRDYGFGAPQIGIAPRGYSADDAIPTDDRSRLATAGIRMLSEGDTLLGTQRQRLRNSQRFDPVLSLAWLQDDPPTRGGPKLLVRHGERLIPLSGEAVHRLEGTIGLTLRRFLHLDVDLQWSERVAGGLDATVLREQRRMRSEELHHLDSPRFGVLAHVIRQDQGARGVSAN